ncbi:MAG: hypothetical protein HYV68_01930 [Candidatus Taylorbacteria bacterium]|nr:hypothetical protein [Candidatus Taylorbacteria bacterium]
MSNRLISHPLTVDFPAEHQNGNGTIITSESPLAIAEKVLAKTLLIGGGAWTLSFALIFLFRREWLSGAPIDLLLEAGIGFLLAKVGRIIRR